MNPWLGMAVGLLLTIGTGIFVASEFALVNLDRHDLESRRDRGERGLSRTISALRITSTHLSSAQLGITLTTLLTGYTFEPAMSEALRPGMEALGVPEGLIRPLGGVLGVLVATLLSMILGELVPKNFAIAVPKATAKVVIPFQSTFTTIFKPMILLLNGSANKLIRSMGIEPKEELTSARSPRELASLVRHSAHAGLLEADEADLLDRTLRFSEYDAHDVMTPRVRMVSVGRDATAADVIATSARTGASRMPVEDDGPDDIAGIVHVKSAFKVPLEERDSVTAGELMVEPTLVPDTMGAAPLLHLLRKEGLQIAVVTDEYGGTDGVVTLEDLVEEIVGELEDEHDRQRAGFSRHGRSFSFDAEWRPDELLDRTGVKVPEQEDTDTVAGFVTDELDRMPEIGDEVAVDGGLLRVERMDGPRVLRLQFVPDDPPPAEGAEEAGESDQTGATATDKAEDRTEDER
ncbi:hemolysin family protein [Nocardioides rotundus]|uniref:hemolysin family protein n=1 Tax=Nocardioides rotundus TaxID=1774216 RepID=UPI001CBD8B18|nr:hemolysin family protein [Nocardioides rotundus]UAL29629.1 hemolysin family protein [Nocardioides rotundus]